MSDVRCQMSDVRCQSGFSLLELIIYTAIISTVSAVFIATLIQLNLGWNRSKTESEVQQNLRLVMENISQSVRSASSVIAPGAGSSGNTLQLKVDGQTIQYSLNGTALEKQTGANPAEAITTDAVRVTYLNFTTIQNTAVSNSTVAATSTQFALTIEYNSDSAQFQYAQSATTTEQIMH